VLVICDETSSILPEKDSVFVEFGRVPSTLDVGGAGDALSQTAAWSVLSIVAINLVGFGRRIVVVVGCCCKFGVSANASSMDLLLGKSGGMSDGRALL
jgi:hypothetical protein